jgi:hypothetical protein
MLVKEEDIDNDESGADGDGGVCDIKRRPVIVA